MICSTYLRENKEKFSKNKAKKLKDMLNLLWKIVTIFKITMLIIFPKTKNIAVTLNDYQE